MWVGDSRDRIKLRTFFSFFFFLSFFLFSSFLFYDIEKSELGNILNVPMT